MAYPIPTSQFTEKYSKEISNAVIELKKYQELYTEANIAQVANNGNNATGIERALRYFFSLPSDQITKIAPQKYFETICANAKYASRISGLINDFKNLTLVRFIQFDVFFALIIKHIENTAFEHAYTYSTVLRTLDNFGILNCYNIQFLIENDHSDDGFRINIALKSYQELIASNPNLATEVLPQKYFEVVCQCRSVNAGYIAIFCQLYQKSSHPVISFEAYFDFISQSEKLLDMSKNTGSHHAFFQMQRLVEYFTNCEGFLSRENLVIIFNYFTTTAEKEIRDNDKDIAYACKLYAKLNQKTKIPDSMADILTHIFRSPKVAISEFRLFENYLELLDKNTPKEGYPQDIISFPNYLILHRKNLIWSNIISYIFRFYLESASYKKENFDKFLPATIAKCICAKGNHSFVIFDFYYKNFEYLKPINITKYFTSITEGNIDNAEKILQALDLLCINKIPGIFIPESFDKICKAGSDATLVATSILRAINLLQDSKIPGISTPENFHRICEAGAEAATIARSILSSVSIKVDSDELPYIYNFDTLIKYLTSCVTSIEILRDKIGKKWFCKFAEIPVTALSDDDFNLVCKRVYFGKTSVRCITLLLKELIKQPALNISTILNDLFTYLDNFETKKDYYHHLCNGNKNLKIHFTLLGLKHYNSIPEPKINACDYFALILEHADYPYYIDQTLDIYFKAPFPQISISDYFLIICQNIREINKNIIRAISELSNHPEMLTKENLISIMQIEKKTDYLYIISEIKKIIDKTSIKPSSPTCTSLFFAFKTVASIVVPKTVDTLPHIWLDKVIPQI